MAHLKTPIQTKEQTSRLQPARTIISLPPSMILYHTFYIRAIEKNNK